jgi:signal transduction histidine kinase/CheY-like chemotaxis protein
MGVFLTAVAFYESRRQENLTLRQNLNIASENRTSAIRRELETDLAALHALRAYLEISPIDESHFSDFASRLISSHSSVRSLEWIPRVELADRRRFESQLGGHFIFDGNPIKPQRAPDRIEFLPVQFVYPMFSNGIVIGFDINSSAGCRLALEQAKKTGEPALTEKYPVVEGTSDGYGVIAFTPVYRRQSKEGAPVLAGFAASVTQVPDLVENGLRRMNPRGLDLYVFDRTAPPGKELLYYHPPVVGAEHGPVTSESMLNKIPHEQRLVDVGGRQWSFVFLANSEFVDEVRSWRPWILLAVGLLLTGAAVSYLRIHEAHTKRTLELLAKLEAVNRELAAARDQALDASRSKSQFLANVSHEIRTPMNGVLATTELVLDTRLTTEQRELVNACHASGQQLLAVLNDILDLSRCESGKLTLERVPLDLRAEVTGVMQLYQGTAQQKGLNLDLHWGHNAPEWVLGDPTRLRQILNNLMSNALKFTDHGAVVLSVAGDSLSEGCVPVRITIEDTGIGIPPDILPNLFAPFVQADGSTTRRYGGTGLGLAICKQLVALMGGSIQVESSLGQGSRFEVCLTLEPTEPVPAPVTADPDEPSLPKRLRVLVAEDNLVNQLVAQRILERHGCSVDVVTTGTAAVEHHQEHRYDLILMDCQMPELDGYEAARQIRAASHQARVPIIALTAQAFPGDRERCLAAGMDDYVSKPINAIQLLAVVRRWTSCDVEKANV